MKSTIQVIVSIAFLLLVSACAAQPNTPAEAAASPTAVTPTAEATPEAEAADAALIWEGDPLADDGQTECRRLEITTADQALTGPCGETGAPVEFVSNQAGGWDELVARLAPFEQTTDSGRIVFNGQGEITGPAWPRVIDAWAKTTLLELSSGRVSATGRTIMSWWLGELAGHPDLCRQLVVLDYGYAYANTTPCEGGQATETATGWVQPTLWEQFDGWLYGNGQLYQENNYFAGLGQSEMSQAQLAELAQWAETVYSQLAPETVAEAAPADVAAPASTPDGCPQPADGLELLVNAADGYCLLYPQLYQAVQLNEGSVELVIDTLLNHIDPRVGIQVEDAAGRTVDEVADQVTADFSLPDWNIERTTMTLGGEPAVVLSNLPGQDINRRVLVIHEGRLYSFFFTPFDESVAEVYHQMEQFYATITASFNFMPVTPGAPLQAGPECPEVGKDARLYRNDVQGYCLLYPAGFSIEQPADNETVIYAISLQDVDHPKAFIEVTATDQTNPNDVVDAQVAEIKQALPDYQVQVTYGLLVDGQPAAQIDNAPGQDISRKLFIIRGDQLFTLTFVPADPSADGIYQEMEYLYTLVVNSFKFLPLP